MKIIVGKDIEIREPTLSVINYCNNKLVLDNPDYIIANKLGRYVGKMEKQLKLFIRNGNSIIVPFGCLRDIWELNTKTEYECKFPEFKGNKMSGDIKLYDYQEIALNSLFLGKNGVLEAPCGSGKTQIGLALIKKIGGKALWLTHTRKLLTQSMERAKQYFKGDFGTITEGEVNIGRDITFATVQTMKEIDPRIYENEFDIVIVDECHHCVGTPTKVMQFYKVVSNCNCRYKFGLSATLTRSDKMISCVYSIIGRKLHTITKKEVGSKIIKAVHKPIYINLNHQIKDYCESDGMINYTKLINVLSEDKTRNAIIIGTIRKLLDLGKKQLVLCMRVNQAKELNKQLRDKGVDSVCIIGSTKSKEREFEHSVIISTFSLAKEGLDIPTLDVVHFASPIKDKATIQQSAGRVERNYEGKKVPIVVDYVDEDIDYCVRTYTLRKNILKKT